MSGPPGNRFERWEKLALVLVLLAALVVRVARSGEGLPYLHYRDEPHTAGRALRMVTSGDFNPHWFHYGTLPMYLNAGVDALHFLWLCGRPESAASYARELDDIRTWPDEAWRYSISHPSFYGWNRALSALLGVATVALAWRLARALAGPFAGIVAALSLAGLPVHVEHSAMVTTDVFVGFFVLAVVCATWSFVERGRARSLVLAFSLAGLTAAVKYNAALVWLVPLAALAAASARDGRARDPWLWIAALAVPAAAFVLAMPYALLDWRTFLDHAGREVTHYRVLGHGTATVEPGLPHAWVQIESLARAQSAIGALAGFAGCVAIFFRRRGWLVLLFPVGYFVFMSGMRVAFARNLLVLHAFLAVGLGVAAAWMLTHAAPIARIATTPVRTWKGRRIESPDVDPERARRWIAGLVCLLLLVGLARTAARSWAAAVARETRTVGVQRAAALARERGWSRIGIAAELHVHAADLRKLPAEHVVLPLAELAARAGELDALIVALDHGGDAAAQARVEALLAERAVLERVEGRPLHPTANVDPALAIVAGR